MLLLSGVGLFARAGSLEQFPEATAILDEASARSTGCWRRRRRVRRRCLAILGPMLAIGSGLDAGVADPPAP